MTAVELLRERASNYKALSEEHSDPQAGMVALVLLELAEVLEDAELVEAA